MSSRIVVNGIYQHYRGTEYRVLQLCGHAQTLEVMVLYESCGPNKRVVWVQPLKEFESTVEYFGKQVAKFRFVGQRELLKPAECATCNSILSESDKDIGIVFHFDPSD